MTHIRNLCVLLLILAASTIVAAQTQTQGQTEWQRMYDLGLKYPTAEGLYSALKSAAHGGQQTPPFSQLPDWSGLWMASGGGSFFEPGPTGVSPKLTPTSLAPCPMIKPRTVRRSAPSAMRMPISRTVRGLIMG